MIWNTCQMMALVNLAICMATAWSCLCRLNSAVCRACVITRLRYTVLLGGAITSGLQPLLFGSWPSWSDVIFSLSVALYLILNAGSWHGYAIHQRAERAGQ